MPNIYDINGNALGLPDPVTIAHGGTGATTVNGARANLDLDKVETVTGTDVTIVAVSNTRYMCGTLSTLSFTPSATGICDVIFTSGSSKTILTLPNTVIMPDGFEVDANTVYEINILDGVYGVVASWPT